MTRLKMQPLNPAVRLISNTELERLKTRDTSLWCTKSQPCRVCTGKGWFLGYTASREIAEFDCSCIDQMVMHLWLLNAGINWEGQRLSWGDVTHVDVSVMQQIADYIDDVPFNVTSGRGLVLYGDTGVGKTLLALLILKRILSLGYTGHFFTFTSFLDDFAAGWSSKDERDWFHRTAMTTQVLVIDDVGREHKNRSGAVMDSVDVVIQARINASLPTIITTNLTPERLKDGYGGPIFSRLVGGSEFIRLFGADFRNTDLGERTRQEYRQGITRPVVLG